MTRDLEDMGPLGQLMERSYLRCTDDTSLIPPALDDFANALYKMGFINALQAIGFARAEHAPRAMDKYIREAMTFPMDEPR